MSDNFEHGDRVEFRIYGDKWEEGTVYATHYAHLYPGHEANVVVLSHKGHFHEREVADVRKTNGKVRQ